jgi:hypothetical protein
MVTCPRPAARFLWQRWPRYFGAYYAALGWNYGRVNQFSDASVSTYRFMAIDPGPDPNDPLRTEEFDILVRVLFPIVRAERPDLTPVEALREAARRAEIQMRETEWISWGPPRSSSSRSRTERGHPGRRG